MEKKIEKTLKNAGLEYRAVTIRTGDETRPAFMVQHNYDGPYPTRESANLANIAFNIASKYGCKAESRGYYTATLIYC